MSRQSVDRATPNMRFLLFCALSRAAGIWGSRLTAPFLPEIVRSSFAFSTETAKTTDVRGGEIQTGRSNRSIALSGSKLRSISDKGTVAWQHQITPCLKDEQWNFSVSHGCEKQHMRASLTPFLSRRPPKQRAIEMENTTMT